MDKVVFSTCDHWLEIGSEDKQEPSPEASPSEKQSPSLPRARSKRPSESDSGESSSMAKSRSNSSLAELKPQELEEPVKIYEAVRALRKKTEPGKDRQLTQELDRRMAAALEKLKGTLKTDTPVPLRNAGILRAKAAVVGLSFDKMIEGTSDKQAEAVWKSIKTGYEGVVNGLAEIVETLKPLIVSGKPAAQDEAEKQELIEAIRTLERELQTSREQQETLQRQFAEERSRRGGEGTKPLQGSSGKKVGTQIQANESVPEIPEPAKSLSLKQLKETIEDIYAQKERYDQKCAESRLPKETMEQYMYIYLNQIYGLKSLIIEGAAGIIHGIRKYSAQDNDVALFGKILRNECDEDFRLVFGEVRVAMGDILRECLKKKYKNKGETELDRLSREIQQGEIDETYWLAIIRKMYNEEHFAVLAQRIRERTEAETSQRAARTAGDVKDRRPARDPSGAISRSRARISYADLQKVDLQDV